MQITLKSLKIAASLSQETTAYTATILVDGKPAFAASNHGTGGSDFYSTLPGYTGPSEALINERFKAKGMKVDMSAYGCDDLDMTLELFVGDLIEQHQRTKRLDRMVKSKIVLIGEHKGAPALFTLKAAPTAEKVAQMIVVAAAKGQTVVNNDPAAYARALALV